MMGFRRNGRAYFLKGRASQRIYELFNVVIFTLHLVIFTFPKHHSSEVCKEESIELGYHYP